MNTKPFALALLGFLALLSISGRAASLEFTFNYQGRLIDGVSPPTDNYDFRFSLFGSGTGADLVGAPDTITPPPVGVTNGMFTVLLNFGSEAFAGDARWLQIEVRKSGSGASYTLLTPRQLLTLTPYALYSINAGTATRATTASSVPWGALTDIPAGIGSGWGLTGNRATTGANFLGTTDNRPLELKVNNQRALRLEPNNTAPNLIGGSVNNFVTPPSVGATIAGGGAVDFGGGPRLNLVTDDFGAVGGGEANTAGDNSGTSSDAAYATVGGGQNNTASGSYATVPGGEDNLASRDYATVGGGNENTASGNYATVSGGGNNTAAGDYSFAAGSQAKANHHGSFVWADVSSLSPFTSTAPNQFSIRARGGLRLDESTSLSFGDQTRQMLNLWSTGYGIGVQSSAMYQRTGGEFFWYLGGSHSDTFGDPGAGGKMLMRLGTSGTLIVPVLQITGGADVAEPFAMSSAEVPKGAVVVIDEDHPGKLKISERAYDRRVAGIVSGANGIKPGITLHQEGALEGGQNVALSGRVYVLADASGGPIQPGDLLTTSDIPGHAMKVTDPAKAQGAILGKAMGSLEKGRGMVLVLVTLQ